MNNIHKSETVWTHLHFIKSDKKSESETKLVSSVWPDGRVVHITYFGFLKKWVIDSLNFNLYTGYSWRHSNTQSRCLSDREGHGHKAVLYKSQFQQLRHSFRQRHRCIHRLINHIYTKDKAPCYSLPHDMVAARIKHWDLRNISLGCVAHCQSIGSVERSSLRDCLFTIWLLPFLHAEQVCLLAEAIASRSARYSRRIVTRDTSSIRLYASDYNNLVRHKPQCQ